MPRRGQDVPRAEGATLEIASGLRWVASAPRYECPCNHHRRQQCHAGGRIFGRTPFLKGILKYEIRQCFELE